eukprot:403373818
MPKQMLSNQFRNTQHNNIQRNSNRMNQLSMREEGQQCDFDTSLTINDSQRNVYRQLNQEQYSFHLQERQYSQMSSNVRPKSQNLLVKISRQSSVQQNFGNNKLQSQKNINHTLISLANIVANTKSEMNTINTRRQTQTQNDQYRKKEIFSRNLNQQSQIQDQSMLNGSRGQAVDTTISQNKYINQNSMNDIVANNYGTAGLTQDTYYAISPVGRATSMEPFIRKEYGDMLQGGMKIQSSNRLSQRRLEMNASEFSFESSFAKKSPYQTYLQYSALKSQYHHNNQNLIGHLEIDIQEQGLDQQLHVNDQQKQVVNAVQARNLSVQNKVRGESMLLRNRQFQQKQKENQTPNSRNISSNVIIDSGVIPDYRQVKSQLQKKRFSIRPGTVNNDVSQPIFMTTTRKGLGLQKECAKGQLINQKSSMAKDVLKISMDDPLRQKHKIWVEQKEKFLHDLKAQNQQQNPDITFQTQIHEPTINNSDIYKSLNIEKNIISQIPNAIPHDWTLKSSVVIEFQEPNQNNEPYQNLDSHLGSHFTSNHSNSHYASQIQIKNLQPSSSSFSKQRSSRIIYSFKGERPKNISNKGYQSQVQSQPLIQQNQNSYPNIRATSKQRKQSKEIRKSFGEKKSIDKKHPEIDISMINRDSEEIKLENVQETTKSQDIKRIELNYDQETRQGVSSQMVSIDYNLKLSKEKYPQLDSLQTSLENINTDPVKSPLIQRVIKNKPIISSRENIEEAKDINVTSISIKVSLDQRKFTQNSSLDKKGNKMASNKSLENQSAVEYRSNEMNIMENTNIRVASGRSIQNKKMQLKKPPQIMENVRDVMRSDDLQIKSTEDNYQFINQQNYPGRNRSTMNVNQRRLYLRTTEMKLEIEKNQKSMMRAQSAVSHSRNQNKALLISPTTHNQFASNIMTAQSRYNNRINIHRGGSNNSGHTSQMDNRNNEIMIQHEFEVDQIHGANIEGTQLEISKRRSSKQVVSKYMGRNIEPSPKNLQILTNREQLKKGDTKQSKLEEVRESQLSNQLALKSEITFEQDADSTIVRKSQVETLEQENKQHDFNKPADLRRPLSGNITSNEISNQHSKSVLYKTTNEFNGQKVKIKPEAQKNQSYAASSSNQDLATKRTVLMKHNRKYPQGLGSIRHQSNSMNVQTGEYGNNRMHQGYNTNSIPQVQFVLQEDLTLDDMKIEILKEDGKIINIRQTRQTDLPRHSRAAPSVIKRNKEMIKQMKNSQKILRDGFGTSTSFYKQNVYNTNGTKENNLNLANQTFQSRNDGNLSQLQLQQQHTQLSHNTNEIIVDVKQQRYQSQLLRQHNDNQNLDMPILDQNPKNQKNVKIPYPQFLKSQQSQLSSIMHPSRTQFNFHQVQSSINKLRFKHDESALDDTQNLNKSVYSSQHNVNVTLQAHPQNISTLFNNKESQELLNIKSTHLLNHPQTAQKPRNLSNPRNKELNKSINSFVNRDFAPLEQTQVISDIMNNTQSMIFELKNNYPRHSITSDLNNPQNPYDNQDISRSNTIQQQQAAIYSHGVGKSPSRIVGRNLQSMLKNRANTNASNRTALQNKTRKLKDKSKLQNLQAFSIVGTHMQAKQEKDSTKLPNINQEIQLL